MRSVARLAGAEAVFLTIGVAMTIAQTTTVPIGKNGDVEFTNPVTVGTTVLEPGLYRFKHLVQDGQHFLLVSRREMAMTGPSGAGTTEHYGYGKGKEVARVPCEIARTDARIKQTEVHLRPLPDGSRVVTEILIEGEGVRHMLALQPHDLPR